MTLHLPPVLLRQMLDHCHAEHPLEACGILPGRGDRPTWHVPMRNASDKPERRFEFDEEDHLAVDRALEDAGEDYVVIYHSHTATDPEPSGTDRAHFTDPAVHYVIVGTSDTPGEWPQVRSWRYVDGGLVEEPIVAVASCG